MVELIRNSIINLKNLERNVEDLMTYADNLKQQNTDLLNQVSNLSNYNRKLENELENERKRNSQKSSQEVPKSNS